MIVSAECRHCKTTDSLRVEDGPYNRWLNREGLVQDVFPDLTPDQRELLIGHRGGWFVCHRCWDIVFANDDEECVSGDDPLTQTAHVPSWDKPEPPWKDEPSTDKRVQDEE
mgnify:CR=1 FL=1|jgi:hypothetical protein